MLYIIAPIDENLVVSETHQVIKRNYCVLLKVLSLKNKIKSQTNIIGTTKHEIPSTAPTFF